MFISNRFIYKSRLVVRWLYFIVFARNNEHIDHMYTGSLPGDFGLYPFLFKAAR